jgi:hypothetical protein
MKRKMACALVLALLSLSHAAEAEQTRPQPQDMTVAPGQYSGYLDWVAKQHFTMKGAPDDVINDLVQCSDRALYAMATPAERDVIDDARVKGMTAAEMDAFSRGVTGRFSDKQEGQARLYLACQKEWDRYTEARLGSGG